jgi:hypothetical protein
MCRSTRLLLRRKFRPQGAQRARSSRMRKLVSPRQTSNLTRRRRQIATRCIPLAYFVVYGMEGYPHSLPNEKRRFLSLIGCRLRRCRKLTVRPFHYRATTSRQFVAGKVGEPLCPPFHFAASFALAPFIAGERRPARRPGGNYLASSGGRRSIFEATIGSNNQLASNEA